MTEKTTMAQVWEELSQEERKILCDMTGLPQGTLALTKISGVLKAIAYRYHDKSPVDFAQLEMTRRQYEADLHREIREMHKKFQQEMELERQRMYPSMTTLGTPKKLLGDIW